MGVRFLHPASSALEKRGKGHLCRSSEQREQLISQVRLFSSGVRVQIGVCLGTSHVEGSSSLDGFLEAPRLEEVPIAYAIGLRPSPKFASDV